MARRRRGLTAEGLVALSRQLPDVIHKEHSSWTSITFKGKGFAWVNHEEDTAMVKASHDERAALLATAPGVFSEGWASGSSAWVHIDLAAANPQEVFELIAEAWRMTATKKAVAAYDASAGGH